MGIAPSSWVAVNHGFFSGERSLWTAAVGIVLFVLGAALEHRLSDSPDERDQGLVRTLTLGTLLSIGLGFFTGGLQHFPDSPARSAWVVPLGFAISVPALALSAGLAWRRSSTVYAAVLGVLVAGGSYGAWQWLERHPFAQPGRFEMACLIPGHYEAGMRGSLVVVGASTTRARPPAAKPAAHDHSTQKH